MMWGWGNLERGKSIKQIVRAMHLVCNALVQVLAPLSMMMSSCEPKST